MSPSPAQVVKNSKAPKSAKKPISRAALAEKLAAYLSNPSAVVSKNKARQALDGVVEVIRQVLRGGDAVELRGLVTFTRRKRKARLAHNPKNPAQKVSVPARIVVHAKASKALLKPLKDQSNNRLRPREGTTENCANKL